MPCLLFLTKHLSKIPKYYFLIMFKHTDLTPIEQDRIEQDRIGQDRIGQDRIGQDRIEQEKNDYFSNILNLKVPICTY